MITNVHLEKKADGKLKVRRVRTRSSFRKEQEARRKRTRSSERLKDEPRRKVVRRSAL